MKKRIRKFTQDEQEQIRHLYYDLEYSVAMVCKEMTTDTKTAHYWIKKFGKPRNRSEAQFIAQKYGRKVNPIREGSRSWKGGLVITGYGYREILLKSDDPFFSMAKSPQRRLHGAYILEHRYIMAKYLNRPLSKDEIVHHLNGIKTDNRIKNLVLVSRSNHPTKTLIKLLQKRIQELEATLAQQKLPL